jgi:hypothetical protein
MMEMDWYCEKLRCKMARAACDRRLALAIETQATWPKRYHECAGCEQPAIKKEVNMETTKICNKCGIEKPLDRFSPNKECRLGVEGTCKDCKKEAYRKRYAESKQSIADVKLPATFGQFEVNDKAGSDPQPALSITDEPQTIRIDFSAYPEILERIIGLSKSEFRTPEMQILYMLNYSMEAECHKS